MFSYIKGKVTAVEGNKLILECGDIGYELFASGYCLSALSIGSQAKIMTFLAVREDDISLYGFADLAEKEMFLRLINVSGIGPKLAVGILSGIDTKSLIRCIATQDFSMLNGIKGVGKKTAERILLELKDKIKAEVVTLDSGAVHLIPECDDDAVLALMSLGYTKAEAAAAVSKIPDRDKMNAEEIIMSALKG